MFLFRTVGSKDDGLGGWGLSKGGRPRLLTYMRYGARAHSSSLFSHTPFTVMYHIYCYNDFATGTCDRRGI